VDQELKLNEFKALYKALSRGISWVDHLWLGLLVGIEQWYIQLRTVTEVDRAIHEYEKTEVITPVSPVYTERPSDTSTSLPEMRISAPWYIDEVESH
jgi:hypothetical protein